MATNRVIPSARLENSRASGTKLRLVLTAIALLLAMVLGFGAVNVQQERFVQTNETHHAPALLDGRGKWGGYLP